MTNHAHKSPDDPCTQPSVETMLLACEVHYADLGKSDQIFLEGCHEVLSFGLELFAWRLDKLKQIYDRIK